MQDKSTPMDLIDSIAKDHHIVLKPERVDCLFFVYAHVLEEIGRRLKCKTISKISIQEMENALDQIDCKFDDLKGNGEINEDDREYSDIEDISPILGTVIARLRAMLAIYDDTLPGRRRRPEELRMYNEAVVLYNQGLLECRKHITKINYKIKWWGDNVQGADCEDLTSAG